MIGLSEYIKSYMVEEAKQNIDLEMALNSKNFVEFQNTINAIRKMVEKSKKAQYDKRGYILLKNDEVYIQVFKDRIHIGETTDSGYDLGWNPIEKTPYIVQDPAILWTNRPIKPDGYNLYSKYPLYILPKTLKKSYKKIIENAPHYFDK
jgi:hypothetical protein